MDVLHGLLLEAYQSGGEQISFGDVGDVSLTRQRGEQLLLTLPLAVECQDGSELEPALQERFWWIAQVFAEVAIGFCASIC